MVTELAGSPCERFQRIAYSWLRSGELYRTAHLLTPLEELAGFNYGFVYLLAVGSDRCRIAGSERPLQYIRDLRSVGMPDRLKLRAAFVGEKHEVGPLQEQFTHLRRGTIDFELSPAIDAAFAKRRGAMLKQLEALHVCSAQCPSVVLTVDLRVLRNWLQVPQRAPELPSLVPT